MGSPFAALVGLVLAPVGAGGCCAAAAAAAAVALLLPLPLELMLIYSIYSPLAGVFDDIDVDLQC